MSAAKIEQLRLDVEELSTLLDSAKRQRVKDILSLDMRKLETEISNLREKVAKEEAEAKKAGTSTPIVSNTNKCYNVKLSNYCWDQNSKSVKVIVSLPEVEKLPAENITCDYTNRSMDLRVNGLGNKNYQLQILNLAKDIDPQSSDFKVKKGSVVVNLAKVTASEVWPDIVASDKTPKFKPPKMEPSEDPSQGLMTMLKQMYEDGDDDMKRTIAKAWSSNRTDTLG